MTDPINNGIRLQDEEDRKANRHLLHAVSNVTTNEEGHAEVRGRHNAVLD